MTDYMITNQNRFSEKVVDIDLSGIKYKNYNVFHGTVSIETTDEGWKTIVTGEHGERDYQSEFGFILIER